MAESFPLLQTKLYRPPLQADFVPRPRLLARLDDSRQRKLTLVSAPAGFGKTTLVSSWLNKIDWKIAWISLDQRDNDLSVFLTYLNAAIQGAVSGNLGQLISYDNQSLLSPSAERLLTGLINELASLTGEFALVFDDYHFIEKQAVHQAVTYLLEGIPPNVHLIITSRNEPLLPIARLRAQGQLLELNAVDLRFTVSEAEALLELLLDEDLLIKDVQTLTARTEGWAAGIKMAAISFQKQKNMHDFVATFTGDDRYIFDYLAEEILLQQPKRVQSFLLETSILNRLTGSLCDAVTGNDDGQKELEELEAANLFVIPLDNKRTWYRYYQLFSDFFAHISAAHKR